MTYNIYCDESCHLENDRQKAMVLGAVWCPAVESKRIFKEIREIKKRYELSEHFEFKWTKITPSKIDFYKHLIDYFFENVFLHFRGYIIPDKSILKHEDFQQDHDTWYYKMFYEMLRIIIAPGNIYKIYLDIKDTHGGRKIKKLNEVLCNKIHDFNQQTLYLQQVRSYEVELIQLTDLLIGAFSYLNRDISSSSTKLTLIDYVQSKAGINLKLSTPKIEQKFNIFYWNPEEMHNG